MDEILQSIERFNFWTKQDLHAGFSRPLYLDKISKYLNNSLVKVLVGQRRSGKSYIGR
jgi:hypothetical protein